MRNSTKNHLPISKEMETVLKRHLSGGMANWRKLEHFDEVLEEENADKSIIRLPWKYLPVADGGVHDEGYGGETRDRGPV